MINLFDLLRGIKRVILRNILKHFFSSFGKGSTYDPITSYIPRYQNISIGENVHIVANAILSADKVKIRIGDDTLIGPNVCIIAGDHLKDRPGLSYHESPDGDNQDVTIGRNVWLGANVTILKGVTIGDGSIIGAGSVVTRDIPEMSVAVGVPAKVIRKRFDEDGMALHRKNVIDKLRMPE